MHSPLNKILKPTEFKHGDVRADGHLFHGYKWKWKQNRWYPSWYSPEAWKRKAEYQAKPENKERATVNRRRSHGLPDPTRPCPDVCECCGNPPSSKFAMCLDHDHETGKFRGWLCHLCNCAIGKLGDDLEGAQKAVEYLKRTKITK